MSTISETATRKTSVRASIWFGALTIVMMGCAWGCSDDTTPARDSGATDGAVGDLSFADTLAVDTAAPDSAIGDAGGANDAGGGNSCTLTSGRQGIRCASTCVDHLVDTDNCGACGNAVGVAQACVGGVPQDDCPTGFDFCGGTCANLATDSKNCNGCGNVCGATQSCIDGACACPTDPTAESRFQACGSEPFICVDTWTDPNHCGGCTGDVVCSTPSAFCNGSGRCAAACPAESPTNCAGSCVNSQTNPLHCGACNNACGVGEICLAGECICHPATPERCNSGCVSIDADVTNCGGCGIDGPQHVCTNGQQCDQGSCMCPPGRVKCQDACINLAADNDNCGTCGRPCPNNTRCQSPVGCGCPTVAGLALRVCGVGSLRHCVDINSDGDNCGDCGQPCPSGTRCVAGACETEACPGNRAQCPGTTTLGCVDTKLDINHCGGCNAACGRDQLCDDSQCVCPDDTKRCGDKCVDTKTDPLNCGDCNQPCGKTQVCHDGTCQSDCGSDHTLCAGICANTQTDGENCGRCGFTCAGDQRCADGQCEPSCPASDEFYCFASCVKADDAAHCGTCGNACPTHAECVKVQDPGPDDPFARCECKKGRTACGGRCVDTTNDPFYCHDPSDLDQDECGLICDPGHQCVAGQCQ